jgi:hypothetical protein
VGGGPLARGHDVVVPLPEAAGLAGLEGSGLAVTSAASCAELAS